MGKFYAVMLPNGSVATRSSSGRDYTHCAVRVPCEKYAAEQMAQAQAMKPSDEAIARYEELTAQAKVAHDDNEVEYKRLDQVAKEANERMGWEPRAFDGLSNYSMTYGLKDERAHLQGRKPAIRALMAQAGIEGASDRWLEVYREWTRLLSEIKATGVDEYKTQLRYAERCLKAQPEVMRWSMSRENAIKALSAKDVAIRGTKKTVLVELAPPETSKKRAVEAAQARGPITL